MPNWRGYLTRFGGYPLNAMARSTIMWYICQSVWCSVRLFAQSPNHHVFINAYTSLVSVVLESRLLNSACYCTNCVCHIIFKFIFSRHFSSLLPVLIQAWRCCDCATNAYGFQNQFIFYFMLLVCVDLCGTCAHDARPKSHLITGCYAYLINRTNTMQNNRPFI